MQGDLKLVNINDERFWDILFDEACVEGQQATSIRNELEKIIAYDVEKVVEEMNKLLNEELHSALKPLPDGAEYTEEAYRLLYLNTRLRGLIRNGGKE